MPGKQHICLLNDSFPPQIDGVANAVVNYATIIQRRYGEAAVVTPSNPGADDSGFPFPVIRYPSVDTTDWVGYRTGIPFSAETLARLNRERFDLIHSHCPIMSTLLARTLRESRPAPLVFTYHTKFDIDIALALRSRLLQETTVKLLVENIEACDEVWVVSHGAGDNLRSLGYRGELRVMPNGVDFPKGRAEPAAVAAATGAYDLPDGVPVFLFVGRLMWYKGLRIILDALAALAGEGQAFRMVFVGGGADEREARDYAHTRGLDGLCFFTGPLTDREAIRAWYCRADLFLFPSTFDTNGLVVREAAACALASVLIRGSCAAEDVIDGRTGFLIEENAESMTAALRALCAAPERMKSVGETAQRELYLSWEDAVTAACARYEEVMDNFTRGEYAPPKLVSDDFFHAMAEALNAFSRARARRQNMQRGLSHDREELSADLEGSRIRLRDRLEGFWEKMDCFM